MTDRAAARGADRRPSFWAASVAFDVQRAAPRLWFGSASLVRSGHSYCMMLGPSTSRPLPRTDPEPTPVCPTGEAQDDPEPDVSVDDSGCSDVRVLVMVMPTFASALSTPEVASAGPVIALACGFP